jgi:RNA polymerase sigma factor (sigma-70 family)
MFPFPIAPQVASNGRAASAVGRHERVMSEPDNLVERAGAGDIGAFRALYARHRGDVARLVHRMMGPAPDAEVDRRLRTRAFLRLLDKLGDKKRTVFVLHELEGVPPQEIAEIVGAPVLTVRTRLFYARRELEAMIAQEPALAALNVTFTKDGGHE